MSSSEQQSHLVSSATELLQDVGVSIAGVTFYKVSAEIAEGSDEDQETDGDILPTYALKVRAEGDEIGVRLFTSLETAIGRTEVDAAVNYRLERPAQITDAGQLEFANEVGVMALIPYVREAIASITQRVFGEAIVMPIFQRGELSFSSNDADREPSAP